MTDEDREFRAIVADWLANLLSRPFDAAAVARYRNPETVAVLNALAAELDCRDVAAAMCAALAKEAPAETVALDLSVLYTRLFDGVTGHVAVPLYESAYTGTHLFDEAACEMAELLAAIGMRVGSGYREAPDHVSVELALLASLLRSSDIESSARMEARLSRWIPLFVAACSEADPDGFYGGAAAMLGKLFGVPHSRRNDTNIESARADELREPHADHPVNTGSHHVHEK
ncbi:molecular chaperone TorD family protein [Burkholderia arboris]|uniref:TorD/DmsD family molecular chaperone n=1 Tax=Burkholderia arboris TaxID=488730 RepID=UPI001CF3CA70|nr:molecular chaperone TorD family protein [Burkholderia arboris]MCA8037228.1 molecular chaperone TorD family protein [Burkholderia arboris]